MKKYDSSYIGNIYGYLTVKDIISVKRKRGNETHFLCDCKCGNVVHAKPWSIINGITISCGCYHKEEASKRLSTHGMSKTSIYKIWNGMLRRCNKEMGGSIQKLYHDKGIRVCDEWQGKCGFENFYKWSLENGYKPDSNLSIDRINSNGNYEPSNCRWTTDKVQANNTSRNHFVEYNGEIHTIGEWATILCINYNTLNQRLWSGIPVEIAMQNKRFKKSEIKNLIKKVEVEQKWD